VLTLQSDWHWWRHPAWNLHRCWTLLSTGPESCTYTQHAQRCTVHVYYNHISV